MHPFPVTIITGFLGAGKTSFLNHLSARYPNTRFAIIENEFGEVGIDQDLVVDAGEGIFELSNGCICCTINGELVETIGKLLERKDDFDHLLIETTGIAEPGEVAAAFVGNPEVARNFRIDGVICLVDPVQLPQVLPEREEARRQLTFSDVLLVNKTDLVSPEELASIQDLLRSINPHAEIATAVQGDPGPEMGGRMLDLRAFDPARLEHLLSGEAGGHHHHPHHDVVSHSFVLTEPMDPLKLGHWLNVLLMAQGERFYRIKGIVQYPFRESRVVFQSVGKMHAFSQGSDWKEGEERLSKIVFIGKDLRRDVLEKGLRNCIWRNPFAD